MLLASLGPIAQSGGVAGGFESIATLVGNGSASSLTFSNIPSTYASLVVRAYVKDTNSSGGHLRMTFNGDSGNNYTYHLLRGTSSVAASGAAAQPYAYVLDNANSGMSSTNGYVMIMDLHDYASTAQYKTALTFFGQDRNSTTTGIVGLVSNLWLSTAAINSITFTLSSGAFGNNTTRIALYGIKAAS